METDRANDGEDEPTTPPNLVTGIVHPKGGRLDQLEVGDFINVIRIPLCDCPKPRCSDRKGIAVGAPRSVWSLKLPTVQRYRGQQRIQLFWIIFAFMECAQVVPVEGKDTPLMRHPEPCRAAEAYLPAGEQFFRVTKPATQYSTTAHSCRLKIRRKIVPCGDKNSTNAVWIHQNETTPLKRDQCAAAIMRRKLIFDGESIPFKLGEPTQRTWTVPIGSPSRAACDANQSVVQDGITYTNAYQQVYLYLYFRVLGGEVHTQREEIAFRHLNNLVIPYTHCVHHDPILGTIIWDQEEPDCELRRESLYEGRGWIFSLSTQPWILGGSIILFKGTSEEEGYLGILLDHGPPNAQCKSQCWATGNEGIQVCPFIKGQLPPNRKNQPTIWGNRGIHKKSGFQQQIGRQQKSRLENLTEAFSEIHHQVCHQRRLNIASLLYHHQRKNEDNSPSHLKNSTPHDSTDLLSVERNWKDSRPRLPMKSGSIHEASNHLAPREENSCRSETLRVILRQLQSQKILLQGILAALSLIVALELMFNLEWLPNYFKSILQKTPPTSTGSSTRPRSPTNVDDPILEASDPSRHQDVPPDVNADTDHHYTTIKFSTPAGSRPYETLPTSCPAAAVMTGYRQRNLHLLPGQPKGWPIFNPKRTLPPQTPAPAPPSSANAVAGVSTLLRPMDQNATSLHGYDVPRVPVLRCMPHLGQIPRESQLYNSHGSLNLGRGQEIYQHMRILPSLTSPHLRSVSDQICPIPKGPPTPSPFLPYFPRSTSFRGRSLPVTERPQTTQESPL